MIADIAVYRRVLRRETHAARTVPASIVASALAVLVLAMLVLGVWTLIDPGVRESIVGAAKDVVATVDIAAASAAAGAVILLIAVLLVASALLPGRRSRRARVDGRIGMLMDDDVLADAVADRVSAGCGVDRSRVSVTVGRRSVTVRVVPTSGLPIDERSVREVASETLAAVGFDASVKTSIATRGVVS